MGGIQEAMDHLANEIKEHISPERGSFTFVTEDEAKEFLARKIGIDPNELSEVMSPITFEYYVLYKQLVLNQLGDGGMTEISRDVFNSIGTLFFMAGVMYQTERSSDPRKDQ